MSEQDHNGPVLSVFTGFTKVKENLALVPLLLTIRGGAYQRQISECRAKLAAGDKAGYDNQKRKLPAFTASGRYEGGRKPEFLLTYSGLVVLDFDHLDPDDLAQARQWIEDSPYTLCCFVSPGGAGLKVLVRVCTGPQRHTEAWEQVKAHYEDITACEVDPKGGDLVRLCFVSHDPALYLNAGAVTYTVLDRPAVPVAIPAGEQLTADVEKVVDQIEQHRIDITGDYDDWLKIGFALVDGFGEQGREYFHRISRYYGDYKAGECNRQYDNCLKSSGGGVTIRSLFSMAADYGLDIRPARPDLQTEVSGESPAPDAPAFVPATQAAILPSFPCEAIPGPVADYIEQAATTMRCPPDFIGVAVLVTLATAIGNSREVQMGADWKEGPRLFAAIVAPPGSKKSPAMSIATGPIKEAHKELHRQYKLQREDYDREREAYDLEFERWKARSKKGIDEERPTEPTEPRLRQLIANDATMEALLSLVADNPRGLLFMQDELSAWVNGMNQYRGGKGADKEKWLSLWSGSQITMNRKSLPEPLVLDRPLVSVLGSIPPDVLTSLTGKDRQDNGFIDRILFAFPESIPDSLTRDEVNEATKRAYFDLFQFLLNLEPGLDCYGDPYPRSLPLTDDAFAAFRSWYDGLSGEIESVEFPYALRGPCSKLKAYVLRFSLILELCAQATGNGAGDRIQVESIRGGIALAEYFKAQARKVHNCLNETRTDKQIAKALAWIQKKGGEATVQQLVTGKVAGVRNSKQARALVEEMEGRLIGRISLSKPKRGGQTTIRFILTPQSNHNENV